MKGRKIGVVVECMRLDIREGIKKAAELGADGIQVYVTGGDLAPEALSRSGRRELKKFVADHGLEFSALCADYGKGFTNPNLNDELVEKTKACMDLALDLGTRVVTTHIGTLRSEDEPGWKAAHEALSELAAYGDSRGVLVASETGPESAEVLLRFLQGVKGASVGVNYDPANLVRNGYDAIGGVGILRDYIWHTHAKDATRKDSREVPLGEGDVDVPMWVAALDEIGYRGYLTIERESGDDPVGDISRAIRMLRAL